MAVSLFKLPLTLAYTAMWAVSGGMSDPGYKTRKALGLSADEWEVRHLDRRTLPLLAPPSPGSCSRAPCALLLFLSDTALSRALVQAVDAEEQAELVGKELWVGENLEAYEEETGANDSKGQKSGKEKRAARERKRQARNPSAAVIED